MSNPFKMSYDTSKSMAPLHVVLPTAAPTGSRLASLTNQIQAPLVLLTQSKKQRPFDVMRDLAVLQIKADGERPVAVIEWLQDGWDRLAYLWLTDTAEQVKKDPKSVPRSLRMFANLMNKLPEHPTGKGAVDGPRRIVLDRAIEQLTDGVRQEVERRIRVWAASSPAAA